MLERELEKDIIVHAANNSSSSEDGKPYNTVKIPNPKNEAEEFSFAFNGVYEQTTTQETLFSAEGNASPLPIPPLIPIALLCIIQSLEETTANEHDYNQCTPNSLATYLPTHLPATRSLIFPIKQ